MQISFEKTKDVLIVKLQGELDHHSSNYVRDKVDLEIMTSKLKSMILDMSDLNFMDSSGVGVIIGRYKLISSEGGKLLITNMRPQIKRIYEICGLNKIIPSFNTTKDAIENM